MNFTLKECREELKKYGIDENNTKVTVDRILLFDVEYKSRINVWFEDYDIGFMCSKERSQLKNLAECYNMALNYFKNLDIKK